MVKKWPDKLIMPEHSIAENAFLTIAENILFYIWVGFSEKPQMAWPYAIFKLLNFNHTLFKIL